MEVSFLKNLKESLFTGPVWLPGLPDLARGHAGGHCQQHRRSLQDTCEHDPGVQGSVVLPTAFLRGL